MPLDRYRAMKAEQLPYVREFACAEHPELHENYVRYEDCLLRFFALLPGANHPLAMIGPNVDKVWHSFILFSEKYRVFCERHVGFFVDHQPHSSFTPVSSQAAANFLYDYSDAFGRLDDAWMDGLLPDAAGQLAKGIIPADHRWSGWIPPASVTNGVQQKS